MTSAQWEEVKRLFHAALERPAHGRAAWLAQQCLGDPAIHAEVERLVAAHLAAGRFIETPASDLHAGPRPPLGARVGTWMGQYRLDALLGAGGMGEVYLALDTDLGRIVAIKVVGRDEAAAHERLRREARHASHLNHPNICTIHHVGGGDGHPYIVMEHVEGLPLSDVVPPGGLPVATAMAYGLQILDALSHAHAHHVIHRDLKSANVMVRPDGQLKLLDFGLARQLDGGSVGPRAFSAAAVEYLTTAGGTLPYMAPEILTGGTADARTDLWAFGVLLYEMTTGRLPFSGQTALEVGTAVLTGTPAPLPRSLPQDISTCIMRCLEKAPADRPQHVDELKATLEAFLQRRATVSDPSYTRRLSAAALTLAALATLASAGWRWIGSGSAPQPIASIAVLPFMDGSADSSQDYLVDGITESLIGELRQTGGLRVPSRATVMRYRGSQKSPPELARELRVDAILEASVQRERGVVRIATMLLRGTDGRVWTDAFERPAREILALQRDIVRAVASHVALPLTAEDEARLAHVRAIDPGVNESYLKGRYYWNKRTHASLTTAVEHFRAAIAADPTYAPASVGLADCFNQLGTVMVAGGSPAGMRPQAAAAAIAALQIDPTLGEAHAALAYVRHYDWQWDAAGRSFVRAIEFDPNNALVHLWYANYLASLRRLDEAVAQVEQAKALDPLSPIVMTNVGWTLSYAGRHQDAIAAYRDALALDPDYIQAHARLSGELATAGRVDESLAEDAITCRLKGTLPSGQLGTAIIYARAGRRAEAARMLAQVLAQSHTEYISPFALAQPYMALGDYDRAFEWLERAYQERSNGMAYLAVDAWLAPVRSDPRYLDLLKRVGLTR